MRMKNKIMNKIIISTILCLVVLVSVVVAQEAGMTFKTHYFIGGTCEMYETKEECEKIDEVIVIGNEVVAEPDGLPDCRWNPNPPGDNPNCEPNFEPVTAAEETVEEKKPRIVPGHFLYGLKRAFERIQLVLTFDVAAKAERRLQRAEERIRELQVVQQRNQTRFIAQLTQDHGLEIEKAEQNMERARALGRNVTLLAEHIANMTSKHILVLQRVLVKVPEQAKPAILRAINVSSSGYEKALTRVAEPEKYGPPEAIQETRQRREQERGAEEETEQEEEIEETE